MRILTIAALCLLAGCAATQALTPRLDEATGTTKAQRCAGYRADLDLAQIAFKNNPSEYAHLAMSLARAGIAANCPEMK